MKVGFKVLSSLWGGSACQVTTNALKSILSASSRDKVEGGSFIGSHIVPLLGRVVPSSLFKLD
jgi:hypothetical protein